MRLRLLDALSAAAEEITRDLAPGSVDLRLRGREPTFVVTAPIEDHDEEPDSTVDGPPPIAPESTEGPTARINFRLSDHLKNRIEEAAGQVGLSVNAWLVRAAAAALESDARRSQRRAPRGAQRYTGWVR